MRVSVRGRVLETEADEEVEAGGGEQDDGVEPGESGEKVDVGREQNGEPGRDAPGMIPDAAGAYPIEQDCGGGEGEDGGLRGSMGGTPGCRTVRQSGGLNR